VDASDAIELWTADGLITSELAERMRSSLREVEEPERANRLVLLLAFVGAGLIGIGLLLFISSQWDQQSPIRRMALLFAIYLAVAAAAVVASRQRLETTAKGLWFLSSITAGVNIFLAGQIFNMPLNWWQGTALWALVAVVTGGHRRPRLRDGSRYLSESSHSDGSRFQVHSSSTKAPFWSTPEGFSR